MASQLIFVLTCAVICLGPISAISVERCQQEGEGCARNVSSIPPCCPNAVCRYTDSTFGFCRAKHRSTGSPYPTSPTRQNRSLGGNEQMDSLQPNGMFDPPLPPPVPIPPNPPSMGIDNPTTTTTEEPSLKPHQWPIRRGYIPVQISPYDEYDYGPRYRLLAEKAIETINKVMEGCKESDFLQLHPTSFAPPVLNIEILHQQLQADPCAPRAGFSDIGYKPPPPPSLMDIFLKPHTIPVDLRQFIDKADYIVETLFVHEIMHSVFNMQHEHNRLDRFQYIVPHVTNLECYQEEAPNLLNYYTIEPQASMAYPYDFESIMHANFTDVSKTKTDHTMDFQPGIPSYWKVGPQPSGPTFFDAQKMRDFYDCKGNNPIPMNSTRRVVYLANWKVSCAGKKINLQYKKTGHAEKDLVAMVNECVNITETTKNGILANLDTGPNPFCYVISNLSGHGCFYTYQANEPNRQLPGIVIRTSRVMRTFIGRALTNESTQLHLQRKIAPSSLSKVAASNCHRLCHVMPGLCAAASVDNGGKCTLYEQVKEPIRFRGDPSVTSYLVSDWEEDESYNPLV